MWTGTENRTCACTKVPRCKLDVNIELRVSAVFHSRKVVLVPTEEQAKCGAKLDWSLWRTRTAVSVGNKAQVIPPTSSLFIHHVFGTLPSYVKIVCRNWHVYSDCEHWKFRRTEQKLDTNFNDKKLRAEQIQKILGYNFWYQNIPLTLLLYELLNIIRYRMIQIIWTNRKLNDNQRITSTVLKIST